MSNDLMEVLEKLPGDLQAKILGLLEDFAIWLTMVQMLPDWVRKMIANNFIHQFIAIAKKAGLDKPGVRALILKWTRGLWDLPNWEPKWWAESLAELGKPPPP